MKPRALVFVILGIAVACYGLAAYIYSEQDAVRQVDTASAFANLLDRQHAPVIGPARAPVTIVEFFDPACEMCRAFYPHVKKILADHPGDVRLVLRYAPFHEGSEEAVRILEAARLQDKFVPVLEALLASQAAWASHDSPDIEIAWTAAASAGLDPERARRDAIGPDIDEVLRQDVQDLKGIKLSRTPTFFVNAVPLIDFGPEQLAALVKSELERAKSASK